MKYVRVLEHIYIKDKKLITSYNDEKINRHIKNVLLMFKCKLANESVHPSVSWLKSYEIEGDAECLLLFLNEFFDMTLDPCYGIYNRLRNHEFYFKRNDKIMNRLIDVSEY